MIYDIIEKNKSKTAIVVVGYNRVYGLKRLLDNLNKCHYPEDDIPLIISIDASGNEEIYDLVRGFEWFHGLKFVNIEEQRLGLKKHILQCGSLSQFYKAVIILEDDLYVAPYFYDFAVKMVNYYGEDDNISGISLYAPEINDHVGVPFRPIKNNYDVYAWQRVNTWGQIWTWNMWEPFIKWHNQWVEDFGDIDMPRRIKNFKRAWSKFYAAYSVLHQKFHIYPYHSLLTNFNDAGGEHTSGDVNTAQVAILQYKKDYNCGAFDKLVKYDIYGQNLALPSWLNINSKDIVVDMYGLKEVYKGRYVLAPFKLPYKVIRSYGCRMRPIEINVKYGIDGNDMFLYDRESSETVIPPSRLLTYNFISYNLQGFNAKYLMKYLPIFIMKYLKWKFTK